MICAVLSCRGLGWLGFAVLQGLAFASVLGASAATELPSLSRAMNDPWCAITNLPPASLRPFEQPPGTRRMVARLEQIRVSADPRANPFLSDRIAARIAANLPGLTRPKDITGQRYQLGMELMKAGRTLDALGQFQALEDYLASVGGSLSDRSRLELRLRKAIGFLRLGEEQNCLANHNAESCLMPLSPSAFHRLPQGSRSAKALLLEHLQEFPDDPSARWLLNIACMTLGEYPEKVPEPYRIPARVFESEYPLPKFPDVAALLGLDVDNLAGGCVVEDFDNDGYTDIVTSSMALDGQLRFFRNDGRGGFVERTREAGLLGLTGGLNVQQTDYNNDGWMDLWVPRGAWWAKAGRIPRSLLRNNGDGTFTDVTEEARILTSHPSQTSVWFDYDGDGWLDVFVGNETTDPKDPDPCELFHNNRDGTFTDVAREVGLDVSLFVKGVTSADYNRDGRPDLYISVRGGKNLLFRNDGLQMPVSDGKWKFAEVGAEAGVQEPIFSFPTWFFDYDNDGWEDLFVSGYLIQNVGDIASDYLGLPNNGTKSRLYRNRGDGTFEDVTRTAHLDKVCHTMGCSFGDLDNDGWLDFYLATGDPDFSTLIPNRMFRSASGKFFQEVTTAGGFGHLQKGHGVGFADLDNDGDQDVYVVMGGAYPGDHYRNSLFLNPGTTNHWLVLKLDGVRANRAAIGARIAVTVDGAEGRRTIHRTVGACASFGSSPVRQEIGLGGATRVVSVDIVWPGSGLSQQITGLAPDRGYRIREGTSTAVDVAIKPVEFNLRGPAHHDHPLQSSR